MNNKEGKKRQPRTPLSPEEVKEMVLLKKIRAHKRIERYRKTKAYTILNIFNVISFFIYCELFFCFLGPCNYQTHYSKNINAEYGRGHSGQNEWIVSRMKIVSVDGKLYEFEVNEPVKVPAQFSAFEVGKDFLLQKEIKGTFSTSQNTHRIQRASPILFLCVFVAIFSFIFFSYNLNQNPDSLRAITVINAITLLVFLVI